MPTNKSLGLIAALALASHAPGLKKKEENKRRIVTSPERCSMESEELSSTPSESVKSANTSCDTISDDEGPIDKLDAILNDPIFNQAVKQVKNTLNNNSHNSNRNASMLCMNDPQVKQAILQARLAMRNPEIQELARKNTLDASTRTSLYR
ncbi:hypothetical protein K502DRAFT_352075 [Neoconidiobolus thromboides FSU 785]|nr:hypothetical protein K502DRAFT_352075 [Neoconidiobolus thromboides FSU 785]